MSTGRTYHSTRREEQARQTRLRIRQAARELFANKGFTATTIDEIARNAGVSPATLYAAFDSKAGIVSAMLEELEETVAIGPRLQELFDEPDPHRQLRLYVSAHVYLFSEGADILRAAMRAIESPEVATLNQDGDAHRRGVIEALVNRWHSDGALRNGLDARAATDRLWLLTTVEGYLNAVDRLGWTPDEYETWLADLAENEILKPQPRIEPAKSSGP